MFTVSKATLLKSNKTKYITSLLFISFRISDFTLRRAVSVDWVHNRQIAWVLSVQILQQIWLFVDIPPIPRALRQRIGLIQDGSLIKLNPGPFSSKSGLRSDFFKFSGKTSAVSDSFMMSGRRGATVLRCLRRTFDGKGSSSHDF